MELSDRRSGAVQVGEFIKIYARDRPGKSEKKVIEPLLNITVRQSRQSGVARATCPD